MLLFEFRRYSLIDKRPEDQSNEAETEAEAVPAKQHPVLWQVLNLNQTIQGNIQAVCSLPFVFLLFPIQDC
jgi:hypothetical protein